MARNQWLWGLAVVAGCAAGPEVYRPTENVTAQSSTGEPAASYDLQGPNGRIAEVLVWSDGSERENLQNGPQTVLHVGLEIRNVGNAPVALDGNDVRLEAVRIGRTVASGAPLLSLQPSDGGDMTVAPGADRQFQLTFAAPTNPSPDQLDAFRVRWSLMSQGQRYMQFTPFVEDQTRRRADYYAYAPVYGYYDPWFYDPFYPTFVVVHRAPIRHAFVQPHVHHR